MKYTKTSIGILMAWGTIVGILTAIVVSHSTSMIFIFSLSSGVLCLSLLLMQKAVCVFNIKQLTIPGFFYLTYLVFILLPSFFVGLDKPAPYRDTYFFAVTSVLLTVPLGIWMANFVLRFRREEIKAFFSKPVEGSCPSYPLLVIFLLFLVGALSLVFLYFIQVRVVPLFAALRNPGAYSELVLLREEAFKLLDTPLRYPYFWLRVLIFPFLTILALGYYLWTKRRVWLMFFIVSLVVGTFYAGLSLAKWPVVVMFLMIFLFVYVYRQGHVSKGFAVLLLGLMLAFPVFVILIITSGMDVELLGALRAISVRVFYRPAESIYYYFEIFPDSVDYLYGRSIGKLAWVMGWDYFNVPNYVYLYRFPHRLSSGSANAGFIGGLNADFGIFGVLLGGLCVGILMQFIQVYLLRKKKTILNMSVYSFLVFAFFLLNFSSLPVVLLSNGVILALMLPWVISALENFFKETVQN